MILTILYFLAALLLLVIVHEFGHFWMARRCGVKVLRFSFGFGRVLAAWHDKQGTAYTWSLWPLGGYVKMLDETEGPVLPEERHRAFDKQSIGKRLLIVLAGPAANILLAILLFWLVLMIGVKGLVPIVGSVTEKSPAARAGLLPKEQIVGINGVKVYQWQDLNYALLPLLNQPKLVTLSVKSPATGKVQNRILSVPDNLLQTATQTPLDTLGIKLFVPNVPPVIGEIVAGGPAEVAGFNVGDKITAFGKHPITDWMVLLEKVKSHPDTTVQFTLLRAGKMQQLTCALGHQTVGGEPQGWLGVTSKKIDWDPKWLPVHRENPWQAFTIAIKQTYQVSSTMLSLMGRLVTGHSNTNQLSGPVGIAQGAGQAGRAGITAYLSFLAMVSLSLAVLNILPVPLLDGGHVLFLLLEAIKGKPLSLRLRQAASFIGLFLLIFVMLLAFVNDMSRL